MNGYSGLAWMANAHAFGARDYDQVAMKDTLVRAADKFYDQGESYRTRGYVACSDDKWEFSVSRTLEYSIDDFSLAQLCRSVGDSTTADRLQRRAQNVFNLLDPDTRYLRPRLADGSWATPFQPTGESGFNEGNSTQYTWSVPQNAAGLIARLGGEQTSERRLDAFCSKVLVDGWNTQEPYFWISNEPCFGVPFVYHWLGRPDKTQEVLRRVAAVFSATPDGLPGDDDVGATSAYLIWISTGLYPAIPGTGGFVITAPLVDRVKFELGDGRTLAIKAHRGGKGGDIIQSVELNGKAWTSSWLPLAALHRRKDNVLVVTLGAKANSHWGVAPSDRPPSFGSIP
jgi:predicted alpha-1,2-mannosidase